MRIAFLPLSLLIAVGAAGQGQFDTFVPDRDPSMGGCSPNPFDPTWNNAVGEVRFQQLLLAPFSKPNRFTDLSVAPCTPGAFAARLIEVRLSHTPANALSSNFDRNLPNPVVVLRQQNYKTAMRQDRWSPLSFDCPFRYDGTSNLVIEVRYTGGLKSANFDGTVRISRGIPILWRNGPNAFSATTGQLAIGGGFKLRATNAQIWYASVGAPQPGNFVVPIYDNSAGGNAFYAGAASFAGQQFRLGCWPTDLAFDTLFFLTINNLIPNIFVASQGRLSDGVAKTRVNIPRFPGLIGISIFQNFATYDARGIRSIARGNSFTIRR